jgi:hypothetical protein
MPSITQFSALSTIFVIYFAKIYVCCFSTTKPILFMMCIVHFLHSACKCFGYFIFARIKQINKGVARGTAIPDYPNAFKEQSA